MTLAELATLLQASPKSYNDLTTQQKQDFRDLLAAKTNGFDGTQRAWFKNWWFVVTQTQVDAINATLPARTRVQGITFLGTMYLNIDLATDAMDPGSTYFAARTILRTLVIANVTPV